MKNKFENLEQENNHIDNIQVKQEVNKNLTSVLFVYSLFEDKQEKINNKNLFDKLKKYIEENSIDLGVFKKYNKELILWLSLCINDNQRLTKLKNSPELLKAKNITEADLGNIVSQISDIVNAISEKIPDIISDNEIDFKKRLKKINSFFKFSNIEIDNINIILDNPLNYKDSGFCLDFGDEIIINTNSDNIDNFDHEFLHTQINRIIDNLDVDDEFIKTINDLISQNPLIKDYGVFSNTNRSILYEEFIRTYVNYFSQGVSLSKKLNDLIVGLDQPEFIKKLEETGKTKTDILNEFKDQNRFKFYIYSFLEEYSKQQTPFEEYIKQFPKFIKQFS